MRLGVVYILFCEKSGKSYVGQSWTDEARWKAHVKTALSKNEKLRKFAVHHAIAEHGPDSFKKFILCECETQDELDQWEDFFISFFNTIGPNGYNCKRGGSRGKLSEETKMKLSRSKKGRPSPLKGRHLSSDHKKKLGALAKGRKLSSEHSRKIGDALRGRKMSLEQRKKISRTLRSRNAHPPKEER